MSNVNGKLSYLGLLIKHSESIPNTGNDKAAVQKRIIKICDSIEESLKYDDELHKKIDEAKLEGVKKREEIWVNPSNLARGGFVDTK